MYQQVDDRNHHKSEQREYNVIQIDIRAANVGHDTPNTPAITSTYVSLNHDSAFIARPGIVRARKLQ